MVSELSDGVSGSYNHPEGVAAASFRLRLTGHLWFADSCEWQPYQSAESWLSPAMADLREQTYGS
jgi:hypothetical protein